jgi:hypothetical protein
MGMLQENIKFEQRKVNWQQKNPTEYAEQERNKKRNAGNHQKYGPSGDGERN